MNFKLPTLFFGSFLLIGSNLIAQDVVTTLSADGPGDTYELITSVFAPTTTNGPIESPDAYHSPSLRHISEIFDVELNQNVFKFDMHVDPDREPVANKTDRQRNEIKTYNSSPNETKAKRGELVEYSWKFKLDDGFQASNNFTHLFQIKASGGSDSDKPLLTLTPRRGNGTPDMELIYNPTTGSGPSDQKFVDNNNLQDFVGKWLEVKCVMYVNGSSAEIAGGNPIYNNFQKPGSLEFEIKEVATGSVLMSYQNNDLDLDREFFSFNRPKWGIYRSLNSRQFLRDESVLFADFKITEIDQDLLSIEDFNISGPAILRNPVNNVLQINQDLKGSMFNVYSLTGKKIISTSATEIDLSDRATGLYFLTIEKDAKAATIKFSLVR